MTTKKAVILSEGRRGLLRRPKPKDLQLSFGECAELSAVIDKTQSRTIRSEIRSVLLNTWDPICIKDEPRAQDEYDDYVGRFFDLLTSGATDKDVVDYLHWSVYDQMGLDATRDDMLPTLVELREINLLPASSDER